MNSDTRDSLLEMVKNINEDLTPTEIKMSELLVREFFPDFTSKQIASVFAAMAVFNFNGYYAFTEEHGADPDEIATGERLAMMGYKLAKLFKYYDSKTTVEPTTLGLAE